MPLDGERVTSGSEPRTMRCPECRRVASVPSWCTRPICVHAWGGCAPEIWNRDDPDVKLEQSPDPHWREPGPETWVTMVEVVESGHDEQTEDEWVYTEEKAAPWQPDPRTVAAVVEALRGEPDFHSHEIADFIEERFKPSAPGGDTGEPSA
jgi:hypothetical protein